MMVKQCLKVIILIFSASLFANTPPEIAKLCMDCHGKNGVSDFSDVPTIAGQPAIFIEETLFAYRDKIRPEIKSKFRYGDTSRPETDMKTIANQLNYQQIVELADFFSGQKFVPAKQDFDASLVAKGKQVHWQKCKICHRENGKVPAANAAILAGQWSDYLIATMAYLRDGRRDTDTGMKDSIQNLSEQDWQALVAFYASQQ